MNFLFIIFSVSGFFGRKIGVKGSQFITCSLVIITALLAITFLICYKSSLTG